VFVKLPRHDLGPTYLVGPRTISLSVNRGGSEADQSLSSSTELKNKRSYTSTPPYAFMLWPVISHRQSFTS
jgi:hypothetical protein